MRHSLEPRRTPRRRIHRARRNMKDDPFALIVLVLQGLTAFGAYTLAVDLGIVKKKGEKR